jgi:uncharacterized protein
MIEIGNYAELTVMRKVDFGVYLDGGPLGDILLPQKYIYENLEEGDQIEVFLYCDSEDRIIATKETPLLTLGEIKLLNIKDVSGIGAFADWGVNKDLLIPFSEQMQKMEANKSYLIKLLFDEKTGRLFGSNKLNKYLSKTNEYYAVGDAVKAIISNKTDLGFNVILDNKFLGIIYDSELFKPVKTGESHLGYIKNIREDGKIDVTLELQGYRNRIDGDSEKLLKLLEKTGFLDINDKSEPDLIYQKTEMSKKAFKKAVGNLYKQKIIIIEDKGISIVE